LKDLLRIAPQLALFSLRMGRVRSFLVVLSFAVGAALILLAVSVPSASRARDARESGAIPIIVAENAPPPQSHALVTHLPGTFLGHTIRLDAIAGVGENPPVPPGLERLPGPGEVAVSPALASLLRSPPGALLRPRIPGRIVAIVAPEGLPSPDSLVGYVGLPQGDLVHPEVVIRYQSDAPMSARPVTLGVWIGVVLLLLAILAPIATILSAATRLSSRTREARLATLRLTGASAALIRMSAALEAGGLALVGAVLGVPAYLRGRSILARLFPDPYRWFPEDLDVSTTWMVVLVLAVTSFAMLISLFSMRRVILSPLGVVRRSAQPHERPVGLWLMAAGVVLLILAPVLARISLERLGMVSVALGLCVTVLGMILALPWLVRRVAERLSRRGRHSWLLIGMYSLGGDLGTLGRAAAAVAVIVLVGAAGQAVVLASTPTDDTIALRRAEVAPNTVFVSGEGTPREMRRALEGVRGVRGVEDRETDLWGGTGQSYFAVETDGSAATKERIKNAMAFDTRFLSVESATDLRRRYLGPWNSVRGLVEGLVAIALVVIWASLMVSTIDRTIEQRRPLAALAAIGARGRVLRASVAVQAVLPLVLSVTLGWLLSVPVTTLLFSAVRARLLLPIRFSVWLAGVLVALTVATTAITIPWIRGLATPGSLRTE
jgi:hypothetical protein